MSRIALLAIMSAFVSSVLITEGSETQDIEFISAHDGSRQNYVLILPEAFDAAQSHDLLVCLHGHGSDRWQFVRDERGETRAARDAAKENAMIFVSPDYRARTSWMGPAAEADMLQILQDLKKQFNIGRTIMSGGSMGASSAMTFTALHPDLVNGVVALNGLADHTTYTSFQDAIAASFGGNKETVPDEYRKRSAVFFPERFTMPLAVTTGGKDTTVPPQSVLQLAEAVRKHNPFVHVDDNPKRGHETDYNASLAAYRFVIGAPPAVPVRTSVVLNGESLVPSHGSASGVWFYSANDGRSQALLTGHGTVPGCWRLTTVLREGDELRLRFAFTKDKPADVEFAVQEISGGPISCRAEDHTVVIRAAADGAIRLTHFSYGGLPLTFVPERRLFSREPVACSPDPLPAIAEALIEWDWRMQDGIDIPCRAQTYRQAAECLLAQLEAADLDAEEPETLRASLPAAEAPERAWETYWLTLHRKRRQQMLSDPLFSNTPLLFVKHVPSVMSHQLTQVYGYCSRPGGGLFILTEPGKSMRTRNLTPSGLPPGNFMTPELSFDAEKLLFAYCPVKEAPTRWNYDQHTSHLRYHIYEMALNEGVPRALTEGDTDNFFPLYLPGGDILFSSTRRGGYHRCGRGPCFVYTLARMGPGGEDPHSISFHETNEWDPCLLNDGRIIYTRWDYVDRNAVLYQQLWTTRPDGTNTRIYYGNNTWNPAGIWEARSIPGSNRIMATASPHHGMSAGSTVLVDIKRGVDGGQPLIRLTPDVRFPESESPLARGPNPAVPYDFDTAPTGYWGSPLRDPERQTQATEAEERWPGHCYKSPWPLSETRFIVSYSFDRLVGEPGPNIPNMFGIYLADAFGNRELLYRDPNISSLWARPLASRTSPASIASVTDSDNAGRNIGTFFLSNVMQSWPYLPADMKVTHLRIIQMLLKTTPNIDSPKVAAGLGAPGRQILGTVPVEDDGSAYFEAPARTPMLFQALDAKGRAIQTMRSLVYLQPGENESCAGCHENRMGGYTPRAQAAALHRPPSPIVPGPDGSQPFSYPRLVQPVLDQHCLQCHDGKIPERPVLTGQPDGKFTKSFNVLVKYVSYSAWGCPNGNYEPLTEPLRFGAIASPLAKKLEGGHSQVELNDSEWARLYTWMDANGAFFGTFDLDEQKKQLAGEQIAGPEE